MQSLGLNTIRTFVPFEQFGGAHVDPGTVRLAGRLSRPRDAHGLKVLCTLFDFRTDYRLLLCRFDRHLERC